MKRFRKQKLICAAVLSLALSFFIGSAAAIPITDTVTVNGTEWAQASLLNGFTWDQIVAECPAGNCDGGSLNNYDLNGWTWASLDEVGTLFASLTPFTFMPNPQNNPAVGSSWAPSFFDVTGYTSTFLNATKRTWAVWTRSTNPGFSSQGGFALMSDEFSSVSTDRAQTRYLGKTFTRAAVLFRPAAVPEPATFFLLGLGLASIGFSRRKAK